jgi:signal peptidase I
MSRRLGFALAAVVALAALVAAVVLLWPGGDDDARESASGGDQAEGPTRFYRVPSLSMAPTFEEGEVLLVDLDAYERVPPQIGDVVVAHPPAGVDAEQCGRPAPEGSPCPEPTPGRSDLLFLRRVVAGPGNSLAIEDGVAVVDGTPLEEPYAQPCSDAPACDLPEPAATPPGSYFLLGDNRGGSLDGRFTGPVPLEWIIGRVRD